MIGDAYAFIDPMFSSGVFLAMHSAFESVTAVDHWLRGDLKMAERAFRRFEQTSMDGPKLFSWFIYRITSPTIRRLFMYPRNVWRLQEAMLSLLAGDIFRNTPVRPRLAGFKLVYYLASLLSWPQSYGAWARRRRNRREAFAMETAARD